MKWLSTSIAIILWEYSSNLFKVSCDMSRDILDFLKINPMYKSSKNASLSLYLNLWVVKVTELKCSENFIILSGANQSKIESNILFWVEYFISKNVIIYKNCLTAMLGKVSGWWILVESILFLHLNVIIFSVSKTVFKSQQNFGYKPKQNDVRDPHLRYTIKEFVLTKHCWLKQPLTQTNRWSLSK